MSWLNLQFRKALSTKGRKCTGSKPPADSLDRSPVRQDVKSRFARGMAPEAEPRIVSSDDVEMGDDYPDIPYYPPPPSSLRAR